MTTKTILYLSILLLPYLIMVAVNEWCRPRVEEPPLVFLDVESINSEQYLKHKCTWACHHSTSKHCKVHHVRLAKPYFSYIDPIYFGIIDALHSTGNYAGANIVFLVFGIPLLIYFFLVRSIQMEFKIRKIKKQQNESL